MSDLGQPVSEFKSKSGFKRIFSAMFYSIDGFRAAWRHEHAFRQELMIAVPGIVIALFLPVTSLERLALIAVLLLVLIIELLNSAIEAVVDRVSLDRNPLFSPSDLGHHCWPSHCLVSSLPDSPNIHISSQRICY